MDKVHQCIDEIERGLVEIDTITGRSRGGLGVMDVLRLIVKGWSVMNTMKKGVRDYNGVEPSEEEAVQLLAQLTHMVECEERIMARTRKWKPTFDTLRVSGTIYSNFCRAEEIYQSFARIMVEKSPPHVKVQAKALEERSTKEYAQTLECYSKGNI